MFSLIFHNFVTKQNLKTMNTLTIEPISQDDLQLFVDLAIRLGADYKVDTIKEIIKDNQAKKEAAFFDLANSFDFPETSEELISMIESSRTTKDLEISWDK